MANEYATTAQFKAYLSITDTARDTIIAQAVTAASRAIDEITGRRFYADTVTSARTYPMRRRVARYSDGELLIVDDVSTATGLTVEYGTAGGASWSAVTDYETSPDNAIARGVPITALRRAGAGVWDYGDPLARIRVTATWGWPSVPDVVFQATLIQASRLLKRKDSPEGVLGTAEWGLMRMSRIDPDVQALVQHLALPNFG